MNPGRWAIFKENVEFPGGYMGKLVKGKYRGVEAGELQVRSSRDPETMLTTIYVRIPPWQGAPPS
jgi:hypothetical protein